MDEELDAAAYQINLMRYLLIQNATSEQHRQWALNIPWQPLMGKGMVAALMRLHDDVTEANKRLFEDVSTLSGEKEALLNENERLRKEIETLRADQYKLLAEKAQACCDRDICLAREKRLSADFIAVVSKLRSLNKS